MATIIRVLDNAAPGVGPSCSVGGEGTSYVASDFTLQVTATGLTADTQGGVLIEGSLDGVTWGKLGGQFGTLGVDLTHLYGEQSSYGPDAAVLNRTKETAYLLDSVQYIRARFISGDTEARVTATVCARGLEEVW